MLLNQKEFAKYCGVSPPAIVKAIKAGSLVIRPDKRYDTDNPVNNDYYRKKQLDPVPEPSQNTTKPAKAIIPKKQAPIANKKQDQPKTLQSGNNFALKMSLDVQHTYEKVKKLQVDIAKTRGELIDRNLVKRVFAKLYTIDTGELKTLGAKLSPEIASALGKSDDISILKVKKLMDDAIFDILKHIQRVYKTTLEEIKEDVSIISESTNT